MINITECVILAPQQCYYNYNPHNPTKQAAAQLMVAHVDAPPKATERVSPYSDTERGNDTPRASGPKPRAHWNTLSWR